jgi:hypothetical protein
VLCGALFGRLTGEASHGGCTRGQYWQDCALGITVQRWNDRAAWDNYDNDAAGQQDKTRDRSWYSSVAERNFETAL